MTAPLVFLDTETTGLEPDADIWEFAAIRREPDGAESELHLFIEHDPAKCGRLPDQFLEDHIRRYPAHGRGAYVRGGAANHISKFIAGPEDADKAHIVGAVPNFDTERLTLLLREFGHTPPWHYHLIDVENLAAGYLAGGLGGKVVIAPPWDSDAISSAVGVDPDQFERHTAMGDARWARAIYDAVMGTRREE